MTCLAIDYTQSWNREEHEVEHQGLKQVELEKSVADVHLRFAVDFFNVLAAFQNLFLPLCDLSFLLLVETEVFLLLTQEESSLPLDISLRGWKSISFELIYQLLG